jgi:hypothetical protein
MGSFSTAQPTSSVPGNDPYTTYIHFYNIIIDSANGYSFNLPDLTEGIIDSGTVTISIRSSLPYLTAWYPFPTYVFPDSSTVTLRRVSEQPGKIVLASVGATTPPMNYFISLSVK